MVRNGAYYTLRDDSFRESLIHTIRPMPEIKISISIVCIFSNSFHLYCRVIGKIKTVLSEAGMVIVITDNEYSGWGGIFGVGINHDIHVHCTSGSRNT